MQRCIHAIKGFQYFMFLEVAKYFNEAIAICMLIFFANFYIIDIINIIIIWCFKTPPIFISRHLNTYKCVQKQTSLKQILMNLPIQVNPKKWSVKRIMDKKKKTADLFIWLYTPNINFKFIEMSFKALLLLKLYLQFEKKWKKNVLFFSPYQMRMHERRENKQTTGFVCIKSSNF